MHDERERIATDLHEHVLHRLFSAGLTLHSAAATLRVLPARSPETRTVAAQIQGTIDELDRTTTQIRATIFQLQDLGATGRRSLHDRLAEAAADLTPALGFAPQLHLDPDLDEVVPPDLDDGLVAVLRAALANVAAYARAGAVQIDLSVHRSRLVLTVTDDGEDISADGAGMNPTRRAGLVGLTHWARHHHGSVEISPADPERHHPVLGCTPARGPTRQGRGPAVIDVAGLPETGPRARQPPKHRPRDISGRQRGRMGAQRPAPSARCPCTHGRRRR